MGDTSETPAWKLTPGHLYRVLKEYKSWSDSFKPDEELVYVDSAYSRYDSATAYFFYDVSNAQPRRIDMSDFEEEGPLSTLESILEDQGAFMEPGKFLLGNGVGESNYEPLYDHLDYFKSIMEGSRGVKSWFKWLEENAEMLNSNLSRADLLRFRYDGFSAAQSVLERAGVEYTPSPRYAWLSVIRCPSSDSGSVS